MGCDQGWEERGPRPHLLESSRILYSLAVRTGRPPPLRHGPAEQLIPSGTISAPWGHYFEIALTLLCRSRLATRSSTSFPQAIPYRGHLLTKPWPQKAKPTLQAPTRSLATQHPRHPREPLKQAPQGPSTAARPSAKSRSVDTFWRYHRSQPGDNPQLAKKLQLARIDSFNS